MKYFTFAEFTRSATAERLGIDNQPEHHGEQDVYARIELLVVRLLDPIRDYVIEPIYINSGYRSKELNKAVGGVSDSQHRKGQAADIRIGNIRGHLLADLFWEISDHFDYDQLICYKKQGFIHISYVSKIENRREVFVR